MDNARQLRWTANWLRWCGKFPMSSCRPVSISNPGGYQQIDHKVKVVDPGGGDGQAGKGKIEIYQLCCVLILIILIIISSS